MKITKCDRCGQEIQENYTPMFDIYEISGGIRKKYDLCPSCVVDLQKLLWNKPDSVFRDPLKFHGCFACSDRETCPDAFWSNAVNCNAYYHGETK